VRRLLGLRSPRILVVGARLRFWHRLFLDPRTVHGKSTLRLCSPEKREVQKNIAPGHSPDVSESLPTEFTFVKSDFS
jgi:hypothetical protein